MPTLPFFWKMPHPQTNILPGGVGGDIAFHPTDNVVVVTTNTAPRLFAYRWTVADGFGTAPTGTRYTNPTTALPSGTPPSVTWHPSGSYVAATFGITPGIQVYPWGTLRGFGGRFPNLATQISVANYVRWYPSGSYIAIAQTGSPYVVVYPWTPAGFGAKFPNPSTLPTGATIGNAVAWHPTGSYLAVCALGSNFPTVYPWSPTGFGAKFPDPSVAALTQINELSWHPSGSFIIAASTTNPPGLGAYTWSGSGFGTRLQDPPTIPGSCNTAAFTPDGNMVMVGSSVLWAFQWTGGTIGFGPAVQYATYEQPPATSIQMRDNNVMGVAVNASAANPSFYLYTKLNIANRSILKGGKL